MKIALCYALDGGLVTVTTEHMGLSYLAAYLKKYNYEVKVIEVLNVDDPAEQRKLFDERFDVIGFTANSFNLRCAVKMVKLVKEFDSSIVTVFGGHIATSRGRELMEKFPQVDFVIRGEGELTFLEFIKMLEERKSMNGVKGLLFRGENCEVIVNEDRELIEDLDSLPFPSRDQFDINVKRDHYVNLSTSRGCYGKCAFCSSFVGRHQKGPVWRGRSVKNIVDEMEHIINTYKFHTFNIIDPAFEDDRIDPVEGGKERLRQVAAEILDRGLEVYYQCCFRTETWSSDDIELLKFLSKSGLERVHFGFDAGSQSGLEIINKRAKIEDNYNVVKVFGNVKSIYIKVGFIMFTPYSTMDHLYDNVKFLHDAGIGTTIRNYFWRMEIYPGTLMEKNMRNDGLLLPEFDDIVDSYYKYKFIDDRVKAIALQSQRFLELSSVMKFELNDILTHTFIHRLLKKYEGDGITEQIKEFSDFVDSKRSEVNDFNYEFFTKLCKLDNDYSIDDEKERLDKYIKDIENSIKTRQYRLGSHMLRAGKTLVER